MSAADEKKPTSRLSIATLVVASGSSMAAAIFLHEVWKGGAIIGAAFTPIIVAIVSEVLRRPVERVSTLRQERRERGEVARSRDTPVAPPPPELERADPFAVGRPRERTLWGRLKGTPLKVALATGALGFAIGAFLLTGTELLTGGAVGGGDRPTLVGGGNRDDRDGQEEEPEPAETTEDTETTPEDDDGTPTTTTPPPAETTTTPPPTETAPPTTTAPAPAPQAAPQDPGSGGTRAPESAPPG